VALLRVPQTVTGVIAMRILFLMPSLTGTGGTERMVDGLSRLLSSAGVETFETSFDPPGARRRFENPAPFYPLGPLPHLPLPFRALEYLVAARRLRALKQRLKIDATISNLWRSDLVSVLSGGFDRKIALCHINIVGNFTNRTMLRLRPLVAAVYRRCDRVVAVNEALSQELTALYALAPNQIGFVDNFVWRPEVEPRPPTDGVKRFVWCGRMSPEKNVAGLLHAWHAFASAERGVQLILLGDGPQRPQLERLAGELGLRAGPIEDREVQVAFAGMVAEPAGYMASARALALSSMAEGLPMVVLEALSLGLPVLAADCPAGGVRAALVGGGAFDPARAEAEPTSSGVLLPVPRVDSQNSLALWRTAFADALHDDKRWETWRSGALARAERFSPSRALERWLAILRA
jgi:glycosyltransferase involved in cell wall biosynthesis